MVRIHESRPPASAAQLADAQARLNATLPDDYRIFLLRTNGGYPEPHGFDIAWQPGQAPAGAWQESHVSRFYAVTQENSSNLVRANTRTFAGRLPPHTIAIATDPFANQILLALGGPHAGQVLFWSKDDEVPQGDPPGYDNVGVIADSFTDLLARRLR